MVIRWTTNAQLRVREIYSFYEEKNIQVARNIINAIYEEVLLLQNFPQLAAKEPFLEEYTKTFRSLVIRKLFKVVYYIDEVNDTIVIVTVWDCRQNPNKLKREVENSED
jgi:plasmid stabilization system protein ParE